MQKKLFIFVGMFAALAINSFAQTNNFQTTASTNLGRPRIVQPKSSGVESSVIVNTVSLERTAFDLLNQKRVANGLQPLSWNDQLASVARMHSQNMAKFKFFSHRGLDNKMVSDRADAEGLTKWRAIGENIAFNRGYQDPIGRAVELWLDSASHRRNLLDSNWKETAVGIAVTADGEYYLTQVFLTK
ncbi:MAG: CAP domain-containing protein [Chloracidobacterium sp.]|nr:CAP domain-containing protein [Chloracidobacterium sp.]